jgi:hypothetical protein
MRKAFSKNNSFKNLKTIIFHDLQFIYYDIVIWLVKIIQIITCNKLWFCIDKMIIFLEYYYSLSTVIYNDIVIWIIMLIFNTLISYFHQKKKV